MSTTAPSDSKPAPAVETILVKVDGRDVPVPKVTPDWQGRPQPTTMLQACHHAGVEVPHYCYHPRLPVAGNCRMCLIEFGTPVTDPATRKPVLNPDGTAKIARSVLPYEPGTPRGAISCATPISPGMELYPGSSATKQMREAVLESLLLNHPLDCPICDQAGECKLQEYSVQHGQATSRFVEAKVHKPKAVDLGPRIVLDDERCILCTRCVRFTRDIAGDDALGIVNRGSYSSIAAHPGRAFDNNYSLNTVDLCPVGALTSRDFRFRMRVWFLKESKSVCPKCATGCSTTIGSREGTVYRLEPRENDAVNASWMCDQGRLNYKWIGAADRLRQVAVRGRPSAWGAALGQIAAELSRAPRGATAIIASARLATEELFLVRRIAERIGAATDSAPRFGEADRLLVHADKNPNTNGARLTGVCASEIGLRIPDIAEGVRAGKIRALVVLGEDATQIGIEAGLLARLDLLVASALRPNGTTAMAHFVLPGAAYAEKRGTFINAKGRLQKFFKAVEPPGDARPEGEFLAELWRLLGGPSPEPSLEGLFNQMARETPALNGVVWADVGETGVTVAVGPAAVPPSEPAAP